MEGDALPTLVRVEIRAASFLGASAVLAALCGPSLASVADASAQKAPDLFRGLSDLG